jgi:hypothetical protein
MAKDDGGNASHKGKESHNGNPGDNGNASHRHGGRPS